MKNGFTKFQNEIIEFVNNCLISKRLEWEKILELTAAVYEVEKKYVADTYNSHKQMVIKTK